MIVYFTIVSFIVKVGPVRVSYYQLFNIFIFYYTMKKFFNDIWIGIKFSFKLPSLPESVNNFHNYPLTRIFRVLGGVSIVIFLASPDWIKDHFLYWIIFVLAILQFIYILIISIIKICYIVYLWKNKKLEVKNSPLNPLASLTVKLATCFKGGCVVGAGSVTILGLGFGADKLLEQGGYSPVFKKTIGKGLGNALSYLGYQGNSEYLELQKRMLEIKEKTKNIEQLTKIVSDKEKEDSFKDLKKDLKEFREEFVKQLEKEKKKLKDIEQSKILAEIKNIKKNW